MTLDTFKNIDLTIEHANRDNFIPRQFSSEGDISGRTLTVQITENGVPAEITGAILRLVWTNKTTGLTGIDDFTEVDASNGIFTIDYPQFNTRGTVEMAIQIYFQGNVTTVRKFEMTVQPINGNFRKIIESQEFSALTQALNQAKKAGPIDVIGSLSELNTKYPNGADGTVLVLNADGSYHSWLYKDNAWADLGTYQEKGIGDDSISTPKIQKKAVTSTKTSFLENDTTENLFDGNYIEGFAIIGPDSNGKMSYIERAGSKIAKIPITPNTLYRVRREVPSRFNYATSTKEMVAGTNFDGSLQKNDSGTGASQTPTELKFTSGPNDKFFYVNMSLDSTEPFLRISLNELPAKETFLYSVKPNKKVDLLAKSEFDQAIFGADKLNFVEKENLFDGKYRAGVLLQGSSPYALMSSANAQTAEIKIEPSTTYYWGRETPSRMNWGTATKQLNVGDFLDGSIKQNMSGTGTTSTPEIYSFTTGPNDQYLYINNSLNNETKYLIVTKTKLTRVEKKPYDTVVPSSNFDVVTPQNIREFIPNDDRTILLKYDGANNLYIYVPSRKTSLYVRYLYKKVVDSAINMNQWRVFTTTICNEDLSVRYDLDSQTEWEGAIKEKDAADFIGGTHGDERNIDTSLLVDGKEISLSTTAFTMNAYDEVKTVNHSILNRADTPGTDLLKRTKINVWRIDSYSVENIYTCLQDFQIEQSKITLMSCRYIDPTTQKTLIAKGRRDSDYSTNILSKDSVGDLSTRTKDTHLMEFWGDELYLSAECSADYSKYTNRNQYVENFSNEVVPRAKMYFDVTGSYAIKKDEVLRNKSLYKIIV